MENDRGYVCPRHGRFVHKGEECPHCEPVIKAAAPRSAIVTGARLVLLRAPPLEWVVRNATGPSDCACSCGKWLAHKGAPDKITFNDLSDGSFHTAAQCWIDLKPGNATPKGAP